MTFHSSLTVQSYARQLNMLTNRITALGMYMVLLSKNLIGSSLIGSLKIRTLAMLVYCQNKIKIDTAEILIKLATTCAQV